MINSYMTDTVTLFDRTVDHWGTVVGETPRVVRCRVEPCTKTIRDAAGLDRVSAARLLFDPRERILAGDFVEIADGRHQVIRVDEMKDFRVRALEVWIQ